MTTDYLLVGVVVVAVLAGAAAGLFEAVQRYRGKIQ